jgi:hypothetical protein
MMREIFARAAFMNFTVLAAIPMGSLAPSAIYSVARAKKKSSRIIDRRGRLSH